MTDDGAAGSAPTGALNTYGVLDPHELLAVTDTLPVTLPAVSVALLVVLLPLHPEPLTDHVYDVAPDTVGTVYVAVVLGHGALGSVTDVGALGPEPCGAVNTYAVLDPHELLAVTDTVALPVPAVSVIVRVVLVPLHPVPLTDHVYEVAPDTAGTL